GDYEGHHEEGEGGEGPVGAGRESSQAVGETEGGGGSDTDGGEGPARSGRSDRPWRGRGGPVARARTDAREADLRDGRRHRLLTPEEERELTQKFEKTQDAGVAARLVTANLRLVVKLAYEYRRAYKNIMDLIQEGNIGLMQAVKRYDPYRG